jgi:4-hydroxybenzoate polyprenyltransferase
MADHGSESPSTGVRAAILFPPLLEALRPHQWVKNLLVFAALVFGGELRNTASLLASLLAFLVFCAVSSGLYLVNDLLDLERDRRHPDKCRRPIASGRLAPGTAVAASVVLIGGGLMAAAFLGGALRPWFVAWPAAYLLLNFLYSFRLKHVVVLDVMCIAVGFVIRVHAGGAVIAVQPSPWLLLCTLFAALLLAVCKRRAELSLLGSDSASHRTSLRDYSIEFLDQLIAPLGAMTVISYASYTVAEVTQKKFGEHLVFTVPFVVFGIFRYLFLVHRRDRGGDPTRVLLTDLPTLANIVLWLLASILLVYSHQKPA